MNTLEWIRQNYGSPTNVFASTIRGMLIASPGYEFYCADFAAVEARLAFWIAEHEEGLKAFREDRKLYEEMASQTFDILVELITKDSFERFIGKESILSFQYGAGWKKFLSQCHLKGKKEVTPEIAQKAVYTYRKVHHPVPQLWRNLEVAVIEAILKPGSRHTTNKVTIYTYGDFLNIKLPSNRRLRYYKPHLANKQLAGGRMVPEIRYYGMELNQWQRLSIWGGTLTNHVVQGIARDLMAHSMMNIEAGGYNVILSIHDELLSERRVGEGNLKEYVALMVDLPAWAEDAPIKAEGWVGARYRK